MTVCSGPSVRPASIWLPAPRLVNPAGRLLGALVLALLDRETLDKAEVAEWRKRAPITRFQSWLLDNNLLHQAEVDAIEAEVERHHAPSGGWPCEAAAVHGGVRHPAAEQARNLHI